MAFKIILSPRALEDLEAIIHYIQQDSPEAARRFARALLDHVYVLETFPLLGSGVPHRPGVRRIVHTPYQIFYRFDAERGAVEVITFWHAARGEPDLSF